MGVRGLNTFFDLNPDLSEAYRLHNTAVVFDGDNLINFLHSRNKVPCTYGGDYNRYASVVRNYFASYLSCEIKPIVIFDGGHDRTDRKLKTIIKRVNKRLESVDRIANQESYSGEVLPVFAYNVFIDVIKEMNIMHARSSFEADGPITFIANHYQCPVISLDSDFYIFDIGFGFIRSDHIDTKVSVGRTPEGQYNFLSCKIYYVDNFLSFFPGIEKSVLPLFSTLLGNDFIDVSTFDYFFLNDEFLRVKSKKLKVGERHQRMIGLLEWLKMYRNLDDAIESVLQFLTAKEREPLRKLIRQAVDVYEISGSNLVNYLRGEPQGSGSFAVHPADILTTFKGNRLPSWFVDSFHGVDFPSYVLNIVGLRRMILPIQVEDTALPSTHKCSLAVRRVLYGLSVSLDGASERYSPQTYIEEYDRIENVLQRTLVSPTLSLEGFGPLPKLSEKMADAKRLVCCALGEQNAFLHDLPEFLQLLVLCIRYWLRNCSPKPSSDVFDALLLTILYLAIAEPRVPEYSKTTDCRPVGYRKLSSHISERSSISDAVKGISPSNATYCWRKMEKYFQLPCHDDRNPVVISTVHSYSQLQSCLFSSLLLNDVAGRPFSSPKIETTFSGSLIYNLAGVLRTRSFPESFLSEMLGPCSALECLFKKLKGKLLENLPTVCLQEPASFADASLGAGKSRESKK